MVVDEFGNAAQRQAGGAWDNLPGFGTLANDPGPGGLPNILTFALSYPATQGDVLIQDFTGECGGCVLDVIRFNGNYTLLFYSDNVDGYDSPADTPGPPQQFYANQTYAGEIGTELFNYAIYHPGSGMPGFDNTGTFDLTYVFVSDGTVAQYEAVPEPGSLMLLGSGLIGVAGAIRRKLA